MSFFACNHNDLLLFSVAAVYLNALHFGPSRKSLYVRSDQWQKKQRIDATVKPASFSRQVNVALRWFFFPHLFFLLKQFTTYQ